MGEQPVGLGTILLVEDEPFVAMVAQQVLEDHGFCVVVASHGRAALDHLQGTREPDDLLLAVVDMGLPDISGDIVVKGLRQMRPALPVIIATGYATDEVEAKFTDVADLIVIRKPYDVNTLRLTFNRFGIEMGDC